MRGLQESLYGTQRLRVCSHMAYLLQNGLCLFHISEWGLQKSRYILEKQPDSDVWDRIVPDIFLMCEHTLVVPYLQTILHPIQPALNNKG